MPFIPNSIIHQAEKLLLHTCYLVPLVVEVSDAKCNGILIENDAVGLTYHLPQKLSEK